MKERIAYIDSLKGLAILLMVMGHVISWQFRDVLVMQYEGPREVMFLWRFIYSFHMPLLMFCSGLFALRIKEYTWNSLGRNLWKRVQSLLFPIIFSGALLWLQRGSFGYWFLWILFQFIVVVMVVDALCSLLPKYRQVVSTSIIVLSALIVYNFWGKLMFLHNPPIIDVEHWNLYPYFCMGIICARYELCTKWFSKNWVYTIALVIFGFMTYWVTICVNTIPLYRLSVGILPISAIVLLVYLFKEGLSETSKPVRWLQQLGECSLEVYILHLFFMFPMYGVGDYLINHANTTGGGN